MKTLSISDVRNNLPSLLEKVAKSSEMLVVTRYGRAIARIVPFQDQKGPRTRYPLRSRPVEVAEDFDEPMPEMWEALAVKDERGGYVTRKSRAARRVKGCGKK